MSKPNNFVTLQMLQNVIKDIKDTCAKKADIKFHISADNISPASLFGGTWEKIEGKFLLAAGGGNLLGSVGGEAEHTLTVEEMPRHKHDVRTTVNQYLSTGTEFTGAWIANHFGINGHGSYDATRDYQTLFGDNMGNSQPHNNMPPYIAVNIWKRVA